MIAVTFICFFLAGLCKAVSDTVADHYADSIFSKLNPWFWNKNISWTNKYSTHMVLHGEERKEKFPLSTSMLVWLTDGWHLFNFLGNNLICIGAVCLGVSCIKISVIEWVIIGVVIKCLHSLGFNLGYNILFNKKK